MPNVDISRFRLTEVVRTASTNTDLANLARAGEPPFLALRADFQSEGRGRRERKWNAPPGSGMMLSVLFPSATDTGVAGDAHRMASCLGLAALRACRAVDAEVSMKWPNDLVGPALDDGTLPKLAGVLGEIVTRGAETLGVVVGIGLNLRPVGERAAQLGRAVVVLDELTETRISPTDLTLETLSSLETILVRVEQNDGPEWLRRELVLVSAVIGRFVEISTDGEMLSGAAVDFDLDGRLIVETASGKHTVSVGDVVSAHVRN